jgi:hypothetical protein
VWTLLAVEAVTTDPASPEAAVQIALIGALAPIVLVVVNELFKRWKGRGGEPEPREGVLAPVEEVPRAQYDALLERIADVDETLAMERARYAASDTWHRGRIAELQEDLEQCRERCDREIDRLRDRLTAEVERRAAAEARLMNGGQQ